MGISASLNGGISSGGSSNSAQSYGYSNGSSWSNSDAATANANSSSAADLAYARQKELMQMQMEFNAREAAKQRQWESDMANSVYTRSVNNMREAGINPILAANMGLSAASVGSGATASVSGSSAPMAQSFMQSQSSAESNAENWSSSHGSSWQQSESGLATGMQMLADAIKGVINNQNTASTVNYYMSELGNKAQTTWNDLKKLMIENLPNSVVKTLGIEADAGNKGGRKKNITGSAQVGNTNKGHSGGGRKF